MSPIVPLRAPHPPDPPPTAPTPTVSRSGIEPRSDASVERGHLYLLKHESVPTASAIDGAAQVTPNGRLPPRRQASAGARRYSP
eukprot:1187341-Prorocentrum_minimum.AAC.4